MPGVPANVPERASPTPSVRPPNGVLSIARRLERAGFETWCVGGAVRDALLGHAQLDWDLATAATPDDMRRLFRRTVPKGIEYGTVGVFDEAGVLHEVTTFRRDVQTDGRKAVVAFGASLDEDLARRDFTINAIAYSPSRDALHDPFGGRADLERGLVRAVGEAPTRMAEDRLRALRAIRFAARFDFAIAPDTWQAIVASAPHLGRLSPERVREELEKTMEQVRRPSHALERWRESGALAALIPPLADASPARLATADCLPMPGTSGRPLRLPLRLASPWLDAEPSDVDAALRALRCSNAEVRRTVDLAARWIALGSRLRHALALGAGAGDPELRSWAAIAGRMRLAALLRLAAARYAAEAHASPPDAFGVSLRGIYRRAVRIAYRDPIEIGDLAVDGSDLTREVGVKGPAIGELLRRLLERVVEDPARNRRDLLLAEARALVG